MANISRFIWKVYTPLKLRPRSDQHFQAIHSIVRFLKMDSPLPPPPSPGILRPLANPETLKNLPMCNFEKPAHGNGTLFQNHLEKHPKYPPRTPRRPRRGVFGWVFGVFSKRFWKNVHLPWAVFFWNCTWPGLSKFQDLLRDARWHWITSHDFTPNNAPSCDGTF